MPKKRRIPRAGGDIEIEIDGVVVRIGCPQTGDQAGRP